MSRLNVDLSKAEVTAEMARSFHAYLDAHYDPATINQRTISWVSIVVFLGALIYFLRVRGPQGHVAVQEDGSLLLVTADGTPTALALRPRVPSRPCPSRGG